MEIKLTVQLKVNELQLLDQALRLYIQHLEDGETMTIVGNHPQMCLQDCKELLAAIGFQRRRSTSEVSVQESFLPRSG